MAPTKSSILTQRLYYERKMWGVCIVCGKSFKNGETTLTCTECLAKRREYASARRERIREQSKQFRERQRAAGLCTYCSEPAIEGKRLCPYHKEYYSKTNQLLRKQNKEKIKNAEQSTAD